LLGSYRHCGVYGPLEWKWGPVPCLAPTGIARRLRPSRMELRSLTGNFSLLWSTGGCISLQSEKQRRPCRTTVHPTQNYRKRQATFFYFIFWPSGGYIPVNLGNSKRRPMPYYCYLYTPGAASGIYYYIKSRKTGAMKLGEQQII
jgi:hypothetical protein